MLKKVALKKIIILLFLVLSNLKAAAFFSNPLPLPFNEEKLPPIYKDVVNMIVTLHWKLVKEGCFPINFSLSTAHVRDYSLFSAKVDPQKCNNFLNRTSTDYNFNAKQGVGYAQIDNCIIAYFPEEYGTITRTLRKPVWVGCDYSDIFIIYKVSLPLISLEFIHDATRDEKKDYYETVLKDPSIYINKLKNSFYGSVVFGGACGITTKSACIKSVKDPGFKDVKELIESVPDIFFKIDTKGVYEIKTPGIGVSPFLKRIGQLFPSEAHFFSPDVTEEWLDKYYKYKKQPFFSFLSSFLNNSTEQQEYITWIKQQMAMAKPDLEKKEELKKGETKEKASDSETTVDPFFKELIKEISLLQSSLIAYECLTLDVNDSDRERVRKLGTCKGFLQAKGEGSTFNPLTKSGTVKIGNYKITYQWGKPVRFECDTGYYLTLIPLQNLPILEGYKSEQSFAVYTDLRQRLLDYKFVAHISVGKAEAQFIFSKEGIEQIHNFSSIFDIRQMFTSIGGNITINELVLWLMKYYDYKKKQEKGNMHSINFLVSLLTNVLEQEKFAMWIAEQKKQSYPQQDLKQDQDQDKVKTNSQMKKDEKEQKRQSTKKTGVRR